MDIDPLYLAPTQLAGKVPTYIFRGREVITICSHRMKTATPGMSAPFMPSIQVPTSPRIGSHTRQMPLQTAAGRASYDTPQFRANELVIGAVSHPPCPALADISTGSRLPTLVIACTGPGRLLGP